MAGNFLSKAIGLAAIGLAGYDTLATTKFQASREANYAHVKRMNDVYMRTDTLDRESHVASGLQNWTRRWYTGDNWFFKAKDNTVSYVSNFFSNLGNNIVTLSCGALALLCGKGKFSPIKVPVIGKVAALFLAVKGGLYVLHNLFGIGTLGEKEKKHE